MTQHLTMEQVALAVTDRRDLGRGEADHLATCAVCAGRVAELEADLDLLGRAAREIPAPPRRQRFAAPAPAVQAPARSRGRLLGWWSAGTVGLAAAAALLLAWLPRTPVPVPLAPVSSQAVWEAAAPDLEPATGWLEDAGEDTDPFRRFVLAEDLPQTSAEFVDFVAPLDHPNLS